MEWRHCASIIHAVRWLPAVSRTFRFAPHARRKAGHCVIPPFFQSPRWISNSLTARLFLLTRLTWVYGSEPFVGKVIVYGNNIKLLHNTASKTAINITNFCEFVSSLSKVSLWLVSRVLEAGLLLAYYAVVVKYVSRRSVAFYVRVESCSCMPVFGNVNSFPLHASLPREASSRTQCICGIAFSAKSVNNSTPYGSVGTNPSSFLRTPRFFKGQV